MINSDYFNFNQFDVVVVMVVNVNQPKTMLNFEKIIDFFNLDFGVFFHSKLLMSFVLVMVINYLLFVIVIVLQQKKMILILVKFNFDEIIVVYFEKPNYHFSKKNFFYFDTISFLI